MFCSVCVARCRGKKSVRVYTLAPCFVIHPVRVFSPWRVLSASAGVADHAARRRGAPDVPGRPPPRRHHQPAGADRQRHLERHRALHGVHRRRAVLPEELWRCGRAHHAPVPLPAGQRLLQVEAVPCRAGTRPGSRAAARHAHRRPQQGADRLGRPLVLLRARLLRLPVGHGPHAALAQPRAPGRAARAAARRRRRARRGGACGRVGAPRLPQVAGARPRMPHSARTPA